MRFPRAPDHALLKWCSIVSLALTKEQPPILQGLVNNTGLEMPEFDSDGGAADTATAHLANLRLTPAEPEASTHTGTDADVSTACPTPEPHQTAEKKLKGKKAKEARKAARLERQTGAEEDGEGGDDVDHVCQVCKATFSTRNKLFTHINKTGHAALKVRMRMCS